jgi:hypothetical protein
MLADAILFVHVLFILFVVGGLAAIWVGAVLNWRWVRHPWFRVAHLAAIGFVVLESAVGVQCPLTVWEGGLRGDEGYEGHFLRYWARRIFFYSGPEHVFTALYVAFGLAVAASMFLVKPDWHRGRQSPAR